VQTFLGNEGLNYWLI